MISPDSIKARLKQLAVREKKGFDFLLRQYFSERMIYRISISDYADNFILKGGLLLYTILDNQARATMDIDFLARRINNSVDELTSIFRTISVVSSDDAIRFDPNTVVAERIKEGADYEGVRVKVTGFLNRTRHVLQFDIGFGDVVVPMPVRMDYPSLLDMERPSIRAYSRESVIAEKFEAMLALSEANSRMKDFYDVYALSCIFDFEGSILCEAIKQTLERRQTPLSESPTVFSEDFAKSAGKQVQWKAFQRRIYVAADVEFQKALEQIKAFLFPVYKSILSQREWSKRWDKEFREWR
jgi:predicted nucleotidyltransferase component of viral defense system